MVRLLAGVGIATVAVSFFYGVYAGGMTIYNRGTAYGGATSDAVHAKIESELREQLARQEVATTAAAYLINAAPTSKPITVSSITVCVPGQKDGATVTSGTTRQRGPRIRDAGLNFCSDGERTAVFPVTYDASGKATIGTPTVK